MNNKRTIFMILFLVTSFMPATFAFTQYERYSFDQQKEQYKEVGIVMEPKEFLEVDVYKKTRNDCSPNPKDLTSSRTGALIRAPQKVSFKRSVPVGFTETFTVIPICGWCRVKDTTSPEPIVEKLIAKNVETGEVYSGKISEIATDGDIIIPKKKSPPLTEEDVEGLYPEEYFNHNLFDFVHLPAEAGVYEVHYEIYYGKDYLYLLSNTVTIEIVEEPDEEEME